MDVKAFTLTATGLLREIITDCVIFPLSAPSSAQSNVIQSKDGHQFKAIWDTGATNSVITENVVNTLKLTSTGFADVDHAGGHERTSTYKVSIGLPNHVAFPFVTVSLGKIKGADVLIGMDIISKGDLAITNVGGKTIVSFRVPPVKKIDFVDNSELNKLDPYKAPKVPRPNDPCPCGSGKKYKKCCGRNK